MLGTIQHTQTKEALLSSIRKANIEHIEVIEPITKTEVKNALKAVDKMAVSGKTLSVIVIRHR